MPKITLPNLEVVYKEVFALQPLYRMVHKWLQENEFVDPSGDASLESMEILYLMKEGTHINAHEKELRIWWRAVKSKMPMANASKFYDHHIDIDWNVIQLVDREIMKDGKKLKMQHGELRILIKPYIVVGDLKGPLIGAFDRWFKERLIKKNLEEQRKMLYQDAYRLQGTIKKYLELHSFLPATDTFHERFEPL